MAMLAKETIRPIPVGQSALVMLVVALLACAGFYGLRPFLERAGLNPYAAYLVSLSVPLAVLLIWSVVAYRAEGNPWTWRAYLQRNRLERPGKATVAWALGVGLAMFLSTVVFSPLIARAVANGLLPLPQVIPDYINPLKQQSVGALKAQFVSAGVLPLIPFVLALNILAEELFWRGIVFPRQELRHGRHTFLVHAVLWALAHAFQYWLLLPIFVGSLALAYAVQRTRSTWVGILAHLLNNALPFIVMLFV
jgi:membrane protease YdiL (CAAX protease family)